MEYIEETGFLSTLLAKDRDELARIFSVIASGMIDRYFAWMSKEDQEDMIQLAIMQCVKKIEAYDPAKGRCFDFYSAVIHTVMRDYYRKKTLYERGLARYADHLAGRHVTRQVPE